MRKRHACTHAFTLKIVCCCAEAAAASEESSSEEEEEEEEEQQQGAGEEGGDRPTLTKDGKFMRKKDGRPAGIIRKYKQHKHR